MNQTFAIDTYNKNKNLKESLKVISFQNTDQKINIASMNYEFPGIKDIVYDGKWLMLDIEVFNREQYSRFNEPSMQTFELFSVYKWFKTLSENKYPCESFVAFLESNFFFKLQAKREGRVEFSVCLECFATPVICGVYEPYEVFFSYSLDDLKGLAKSIRAEYDKFPERLVL